MEFLVLIAFTGLHVFLDVYGEGTPDEENHGAGATFWGLKLQELRNPNDTSLFRRDFERNNENRLVYFFENSSEKEIEETREKREDKNSKEELLRKENDEYIEDGLSRGDRCKRKVLYRGKHLRKLRHNKRSRLRRNHKRRQKKRVSERYNRNHRKRKFSLHKRRGRNIDKYSPKVSNNNMDNSFIIDKNEKRVEDLFNEIRNIKEKIGQIEKNPNKLSRAALQKLFGPIMHSFERNNKDKTLTTQSENRDSLGIKNPHNYFLTDDEYKKNLQNYSIETGQIGNEYLGSIFSDKDNNFKEHLKQHSPTETTNEHTLTQSSHDLLFSNPNNFEKNDLNIKKSAQQLDFKKEKVELTHNSQSLLTRSDVEIKKVVPTYYYDSPRETLSNKNKSESKLKQIKIQDSNSHLSQDNENLKNGLRNGAKLHEKRKTNGNHDKTLGNKVQESRICENNTTNIDFELESKNLRKFERNKRDKSNYRLVNSTPIVGSRDFDTSKEEGFFKKGNINLKSNNELEKNKLEDKRQDNKLNEVLNHQVSMNMEKGGSNDLYSSKVGLFSNFNNVRLHQSKEQKRGISAQTSRFNPNEIISEMDLISDFSKQQENDKKWNSNIEFSANNSMGNEDIESFQNKMSSRQTQRIDNENYLSQNTEDKDYHRAKRETKELHSKKFKSTTFQTKRLLENKCKKMKEPMLEDDYYYEGEEPDEEANRGETDYDEEEGDIDDEDNYIVDISICSKEKAGRKKIRPEKGSPKRMA